MKTIHSIPNTTTVNQGCCCANKSSTTTRPEVSSSPDSGLPMQQLKVEGATCGGCVKSIEQTLGSLAGVTQATMELTSGVVSVTGTVQTDELIKALERAGFPAIAVN